MTEPLEVELVRLRRYLWVKSGYLWGQEMEDVMASDLDAQADERFGPGRWTRTSVAVDRVYGLPPEAPTPPTTVRADLFVGWAYYREATQWEPIEDGGSNA